MAADKAVTAAAWALAEQQYADRSVKISDIAKSLGLSAIALSNQAKTRGWILRTAIRLPAGSPKESRKAQSKTIPSGAKKQPQKAPAKTVPAPMVLVRRVYNTIDGELTKLEQQTGATSQDRERASRALSQMVNSLEKAIEMQREITKALTKRSGAKDKEALAHAEDLRREIAERLERFQRQLAPGKRSGGAE